MARNASRKKKLAKLQKMFRPGGKIEQVVVEQLNETKRRVLSQFDKTESRSPKDQARRTGELKLSLSMMTPKIEWDGNTLSANLLLSAKKQLPSYWTVQEYGFAAGQYKWTQKFVVVGYRHKDRPSKRGDLYVLGNVKKSTVTQRGPYPLFSMYLTHTQGMRGRMFLRTGRSYIKGEGVNRIVKWVESNISKVR